MRTPLTAAVIFAAAASAPALGQTGWGIWNNGPGSQTIVTFDVNSPGLLNTVGPTGIVSSSFGNSLDFGPGGTNLYMATNAASGFLFDINTSTGAASNARGSGLATGDTLGDMSYDHFSGRMLGIAGASAAAGGARLYSIDLVTGAATNLGAVGGLTEGFSVSLAVRPSDGLIFAHGIETDRWYTINPGTLVATPLTLLGWNTNFGQGASFHPASNTLYHAMLTIDGGNQSRLASIDQGTGLPTFLGTMGVGLNQIGDIAFPVPTPGSAMLLLGAIPMVLRRRRGV